MWKRVEKDFAEFPARKQVARKMIELGLRIGEGGKILCGDVEVKENSLARAAGVDRRAVNATVAGIMKDKELGEIFEAIAPGGALLNKVAHKLGFGVVEIEADASKSGILASAANLLADRKISVRQVYAEDPELFENPKMTLVTEKPVPGNLLSEFLKIDGVTKVSVS